MKAFIKEWFIPPKLWSLLLNIKNQIKKLNYSKENFAKNAELKDIHKNDRCFIIGLGKSINQQDLKLLKNEVTVAISSFFTHKDLKEVMPTYYVLSPVIEYHKKLVEEENLISWLQAMDVALDDDVTMFIYIGDKKYIDEYSIFLNKKIYWLDYTSWDGENIREIKLDSLPSISNVSEIALSVGLYLGFKEIYMIGFDHTWYEGVYNYFDNSKVSSHFKKTHLEIKKENNFDSESQMSAHIKIFQKYKKLYEMKKNIFNANADENTYVDTFPKVKYEVLFNKDGK